MSRSNPLVMVYLVVTAAFAVSFSYAVQGQAGATEAPAAFDNKSNGFVSQIDFDNVRKAFEERDKNRGGLGPVYNAQSCAECHQTPVTGGGSQISELRAGHTHDDGTFGDAPGGSLINDRAIKAAIQEYVPEDQNVRALRMSTNTLGAGFVEAISDATLQAIAEAQPGQSGGLIAGQMTHVPLLEAPDSWGIGRFGWKDQHASLLSFAGDAYLNEMGITNRLFLTENTSMGNSVASQDNVPDDTLCEDGSGDTCGEDPEGDIDMFAAFMRSTKAPPRAAGSAKDPDVIAGASLFDSIGCTICHTQSITTAPVNTVKYGGPFAIGPAALANKIIHPYSDFLLHDIGTGDGIVQNGGQSTANKLRTQPLWGARTRSRHMHDGQALTFSEAILRHGGEASHVTYLFSCLSPAQKNQILEFLQSL
jgi:CxxC motif-containing protein (DUF1111 family)